jgi:hypothetical protein
MSGSGLNLFGLRATALAILFSIVALVGVAQPPLFAIHRPAFATRQTAFASQTESSPKPAVDAAASVTTARLSLTDLAWLQGQWAGAWGPRTVTQVWSAPHAGTIVGTLQEVEDDKTLVVELVTLSEEPSGVEYRVLRFTPSLALWEKSGPPILWLMSGDSKKFVFQNQLDGEPQQIVLMRTDPDTYTTRWQILPKTGDPQTNEIEFHRQKPSAGSDAHR